jgi:hypothetical protein
MDIQLGHECLYSTAWFSICPEGLWGACMEIIWWYRQDGQDNFSDMPLEVKTLLCHSVKTLPKWKHGIEFWYDPWMDNA